MRTIIAFLLLSFCCGKICYAETRIHSGVTFTIQQKGGFTKANDEGRIQKKDGDIYIKAKKTKEADYKVSQGEVKPDSEDIDGDGNTDWVWVNTATGLKIVKNPELKEIVVADDSVIVD